MSVQIAGVDAQSPLGQVLLEMHQGPISHFRLAGRQQMLLSGNPGAMLQREVDGVQMRFGTQYGRETLQLRFSPAQIRLAEEILQEQEQRRRTSDIMLDGYISIEPSFGLYLTSQYDVSLNGTYIGTAMRSASTYIDIFSWWFGTDAPYLSSYKDTRTAPLSYGSRLDMNKFNPNSANNRVNSNTEDLLWDDVSPERDDGYMPYLMPFAGSSGTIFVSIRTQNTFLPVASPLNVYGHNVITVTATGTDKYHPWEDDYISFNVGVQFFSRNPETFRQVAQGWYPHDPDVSSVTINDHPIYLQWPVILASGRTAELKFDLSEDAKAFPPAVIPTDIDYGDGTPRRVLVPDNRDYSYYDYVYRNDGNPIDIERRPDYYYPQ